MKGYMRKGITKSYLIEIVLVTVLILCTLLHYTSNKIFTAVLITGFAFAISLLLKRDRTLKINKKKILTIMIVFAVFYVAAFYVLGLYTGFFNATVKFSLKNILTYILPITMTIVSMEYIRSKLLEDNSFSSKLLVTIIGTIVDVSLYLNTYNFKNLESFLALIGFITFASIANNMLYTYVSEKYGKDPVIAYKLITMLYSYIIPVIPDVYIYFRTFLRLIYPLLIYSYLEKFYNLDYYKERPKELRKEIVSLVMGTIFVVFVIGLVSCRFTYGVLVIGSESMSGSIDKGDVVLFKSNEKEIHEGDVIVFQRDNIRVVHRVVAVKNINDEFRYYTKGDANPLEDDKYVTEDTLMGKVFLKIKYIGWPSLWLRNLFK